MSNALVYATLAALLGSGAGMSFAQVPPGVPTPGSTGGAPGTQGPLSPIAPPAPLPPMGGPGALPPAGGSAGGVPVRDSSSRRFADRPTVTIMEFRSSVTEIPARAATDMFITALVETGRFRVVERARLATGVAQEKILNQQGLTDGQSGEARIVAAKYIFEGTISEAQFNQNASTAGLSVMGVGARKTTTRDSIGVDVRVVEADSGVVADAIRVRKQIKGTAKSVGGVGDAVSNTLSQKLLGGAVVFAGSKEYESVERESLDDALRQAIADAIAQITARFSDAP